MSWRTVILTKEAKLSLRMNQLIITNDQVVRVPLVELGVLIIENTSITVTVHLLNALADNKTVVIICNQAHNPNLSIQSIYGHHRQSKNIMQQFEWPEHKKALLWQQIIAAKIKAQASVLQAVKRDGAEDLLQLANEVELFDQTNREAIAAKLYFNRLFGESFIRGDETPINWGLNYGYMILHALVARSIVSKGYLTEIGIYHKNEYNQYNLASDLVEVFRPIVDYVVFSQIKEEFTKQHRRELVGILEKKIKIRNGQHHFMQAAPIFVEQCLQFMKDGGKNKMTFPVFEFEKL